MFWGRFGVSQKVSEDGLRRIFSSNKSAQANRKKEFFTTSLLQKEEIKEIFLWCSKNLDTLKNLNKKKEFKTFSG